MPAGFPNLFDLTLGCAVVAALQLFFVLRFCWKLRAGLTPPPATYRPRVAVLVPCAGLTDGFEENIRSLLDQDYGGESEYFFVAPSTRDPAYAALASILAVNARKTSLLASEKLPQRSSGKIVDLLFALERVPAEAEVLAFADADVRVTRSWLGALIGALADPKSGAATAAMIYIPVKARLGALLRMVWMVNGTPYFELTGGITGQSAAVRKADFEALGAADTWSRSLLEDLSLARLVRESGKEVRFVPQAAPFAPDASSLGEMLKVFNKWMTLYRFYAPLAWTLGAVVTAFKTYVLVWSLIPPPSPRLWALLFGMDAAALFILFFSLSRALPDRFRAIYPAFRLISVTAALCAPLLQMVYLINYIASLLTRVIAWGPYRYRVRGPQDIEVVN